MLVGGHRYKIVVALHKINGNMTAFYIKLNWSNKGYNEVITPTQRICQIWFATKSQHFILYFYFSFVHTSIFHPVNSPRTKRIMLHLTISLFVITILKTYEILNAEYSIFVLVYLWYDLFYIHWMFSMNDIMNIMLYSKSHSQFIFR